MGRFFAFAFSIVSMASALAYIPPTKMILQRVSENAGSGLYTVEQEVQINNGIEPVYLKETWIVENERTLRLTVTGLKELKDLVHLQFIYVGGQKWQMKNGKRESGKIPDEFLERYFHARNSENLIAYLQQQKILPTLNQAKKPARKGDEYKYDAEPFVRLSRTEGLVAYAFSESAADSSPGLWVEQDQFLVRRLRFPSSAEVTAEDYGGFLRGLNLPRKRNVVWNQNNVHLRLLSVNGKVANAVTQFQPTSLDVNSQIQPIPNSNLQAVIEEFYSRFR